MISEVYQTMNGITLEREYAKIRFLACEYGPRHASLELHQDFLDAMLALRTVRTNIETIWRMKEMYLDHYELDYQLDCDRTYDHVTEVTDAALLKIQNLLHQKKKRMYTEAVMLIFHKTNISCIVLRVLEYVT